MQNIKFIYLYRDGANYKSWGEMVFENPGALSLSEVKSRLIDAFLSDQLFVASQISVPEIFLFLDGKLTNYDHCYHEYDSISFCEEPSTDKRSINKFLKDVELASEQGWKAFNILDRV